MKTEKTTDATSEQDIEDLKTLLSKQVRLTLTDLEVSGKIKPTWSINLHQQNAIEDPTDNIKEVQAFMIKCKGMIELKVEQTNAEGKWEVERIVVFGLNENATEILKRVSTKPEPQQKED